MERKCDEENYKKENNTQTIIKDTRQASNERLHCLQITLVCMYFAFIISFTIACIFFPGMKSSILSLFLIMQMGSLKVYIILIIFSTLLYIFCFPVAILEIFLGNIIHPFWLAVTIAITIKLLSNVTMFYISRSLLKQEITTFFTGNKIFETIQLAIKKNPIKIIFMLKLMMIPHMLKNYGLGVMDVTFLQFFIPSLITGSIYSTFWVNMGSKLNNVYSAFNSKEMQKRNEIKEFEIGVIILSLIIFFFLGYYGKKQYEQVQKEMLLDENKLIDENKQITNEINYGTMKDLEQK